MINRSPRINGWKEIATFLDVSARTAQRLERSEGLPVRRVLRHPHGSVYALREELERWSRDPRASAIPRLNAAAPPRRPARAAGPASLPAGVGTATPAAAGARRPGPWARVAPALPQALRSLLRGGALLLMTRQVE